MAPGQPTMVGLLPGGVHMGTFVIPTGNILPVCSQHSNLATITVQTCFNFRAMEHRVTVKIGQATPLIVTVMKEEQQPNQYPPLPVPLLPHLTALSLGLGHQEPNLSSP